MVVLLILAASRLLLNLLSNNLAGMGFHRSELYYIACGERLAAGYVDVPPLTPWLVRLSGELLGFGPTAFRVLPALAGAASVLLTARICRQLGGGRFAQALAAMALLIAPVSLVHTGMFSMSAFDTLFVCAALSSLIAVFLEGRPRGWWMFGLVAGLALLNHYNMVLVFAGLFSGLLITPARAQFRTRHFWQGVLILLLVVSPLLVWQAQHGFPSIEYQQLTWPSIRRVEVPVSQFLLGVAYVCHPLLAPLCVAGLCWLLLSRRAEALRPLGWMFLIPLAVLIVIQSIRPAQLMPLMPVLYAAGALVLESALVSFRHWARAAVVLLLIAGGLLTAPLALPWWNPGRAQQYAQRLNLPIYTTQHLDERFGWQEMAANMSKVYADLSEGEQRQTILLAGNYGQAGALEFYTSGDAAPKTACAHNSFHSFYANQPAAAAQHEPQLAIAIGWPLYHLYNLFEDVKEVAVHRAPHASPIENNLPIYLCRAPRTPLSTYWPEARLYFDDNRID